MDAKNEVKDFVFGCKPGDKVVVDFVRLTLATVKKITPSGWLVTDKGTFCLNKYAPIYLKRGGCGKLVFPCTIEQYKEAEENDRKELECKRKERAVYEARTIMNNLSYGDKVTYAFAQKFLEFYAKNKEDLNNGNS